MTDKDLALLRQLLRGEGPQALSQPQDIASAQRLAKAGLIEAKFQTMGRGRTAYGRIGAAVVTQVTDAGKRAGQA